MDNSTSDFSKGYIAGQLALLGALISNCEADITYLIDEVVVVKKTGSSRAKSAWDGKIEAMEAIKSRLQEAWTRLKKNEKVISLAGK